MPLIRQEEVYPSITVPYAQAIEMIATSAVTLNDIVTVDGVNGLIPKASPATSATVAGSGGQLFVALGGVATGEKFLAVPWRVIDAVNTATSTIGNPVYLSTGGDWSLSPGAESRVVGSVLTVDASAGKVLLSPGQFMSRGVTGVAYGASTTMIGTGAQDVAITITQPAGTLLVDAGCVLTTATVGTANINVKFGTADDGDQICAAAAFVSAGVGAIGSSIAVSGAQGEGAAALTFAADAALYSAAARTIHFRSENSATLTAGVIRPFIRFISI